MRIWISYQCHVSFQGLLFTTIYRLRGHPKPSRHLGATTPGRRSTTPSVCLATGGLSESKICDFGVWNIIESCVQIGQKSLEDPPTLNRKSSLKKVSQISKVHYGENFFGILLLVYDIIPHITGWDVIPYMYPKHSKGPFWSLPHWQKTHQLPQENPPILFQPRAFGRHCILAPENDNPRWVADETLQRWQSYWPPKTYMTMQTTTIGRCISY